MLVHTALPGVWGFALTELSFKFLYAAEYLQLLLVKVGSGLFP